MYCTGPVICCTGIPTAGTRSGVNFMKAKWRHLKHLIPAFKYQMPEYKIPNFIMLLLAFKCQKKHLYGQNWYQNTKNVFKIPQKKCLKCQNWCLNAIMVF